MPHGVTRRHVWRLVHIVADGFITCWGSLYLDGHGEEEPGSQGN